MSLWDSQHGSEMRHSELSVDSESNLPLAWSHWKGNLALLAMELASSYSCVQGFVFSTGYQNCSAAKQGSNGEMVRQGLVFESSNIDSPVTGVAAPRLSRVLKA